MLETPCVAGLLSYNVQELKSVSISASSHAQCLKASHLHSSVVCFVEMMYLADGWYRFS